MARFWKAATSSGVDDPLHTLVWVHPAPEGGGGEPAFMARAAEDFPRPRLRAVTGGEL
jgi:hypothetical protein